ncbi:hypothetical protein [Fusobacterium sp. MFO224]|uniref:hypothetical protein n=1 Tax=Fusobacterium sp. MFO224 TaxID=3378070 RepID=UPI003853D050
MRVIKLLILFVIFSLNLFAETDQDLKIDLNIMVPLKIWEESAMDFGKLIIGNDGPFFARAILKAEGQKNRAFRVSVPNKVILRKVGSDSSMNIIIEKNQGEGILEEDIVGNIGKRSMAFEGRIDNLSSEPGVYITVVPVTLTYD